MAAYVIAYLTVADPEECTDLLIEVRSDRANATDVDGSWSVTTQPCSSATADQIFVYLDGISMEIRRDDN